MLGCGILQAILIQQAGEIGNLSVRIDFRLFYRRN